jgi:CAI-1 autoinducer synthase
VSPLRGLVEVAEEHGCPLIVEESHAIGVRGPHGEGLAGELGLAGRVAFRTAGLGKAFCVRAGLIACDHPGFAGRLGAAALPVMSGPPLPAHEVAGLEAALEVVRADGWRRERVRAAAGRLRDGLSSLGYRLVESDTQIIALEAGSESEATLMRDALVGRDIFSAALFPPTASVGRTLVRLSAHAGLTDGDVRRVLNACKELRPRAAAAV